MLHGKGGYTLVSLLFLDLAIISASLTVPDLGKRLHEIGDKRVVLCDIVISGEKKKEIPVQVNLSTTEEEDAETGETIIHYGAYIPDCYGYALTIVDSSVTITETYDPATLSGKVDDLETAVGDADSGLVKDVDDLQSAVGVLQQKTTAISYSEGTTDVDGKLTGDEIIENMSGYSFTPHTATANASFATIYAGVCKNGNKVTFVLFGRLKKITSVGEGVSNVFGIPSIIGSQLYPYTIGDYNFLDNRSVETTHITTGVHKDVNMYIAKVSNTSLSFVLSTVELSEGDEVYVRVEETFLLSDNLAS